MYIKNQKNSANPTVGVLLRNIPPVVDTTPCLAVLDLFHQDAKIFAIPVVDRHNTPKGLIDRHSFIDVFAKPYAREVHGKKKIVEFMNSSSIIVSSDTSVDDVAKIIIDAGVHHMVSGFIATQSGKYMGIANGHDLLHEITQRKQESLFYLAHYDQLTRLPNRLLFLDRLSMAISEAAREHTEVGMLFIDLDNFKHFNDSMGHGFGDQLLMSVAQRLSRCARENDTVARLAGDEFTIMIENSSGNCREDLEALCGRVVKAMEEPLDIMGREYFVTASIGAAVFPQDANDANNLLIKADAAMYEAKNSGRNTFRHYAPGMDTYSADKMSLETDLRIALERKEFMLYYQPQMSLPTRQLAGFEALIRWRHPRRGLVSPISFIEIAEKTGLIVPMGKWVLEEACRQQMRWINQGLPAVCMSVNISAMQFYQADFCDHVDAVLNETGLPPHLLGLELTESLCMFDVNAVLATLNRLNEMGVKLAIDDFGTGYSNLSYLKRFPIGRLKVDQSFVRQLDSEPINVDIVRAIAALGRSLSLELVAEGVETEAELLLVEANGCGIVQGYLFSKPMSEVDMETWVREYLQRPVHHATLFEVPRDAFIGTTEGGIAFSSAYPL
jgi:diguanylate cyclase (GGDEF)-like protein